MQEIIFGIFIGLIVAVPVGPTAVLCIRRTLLFGRFAGFASGLGAASIDGIFGLIAGFGYATVIPFIHTHNSWIKSLGGIILLVLGIYVYVNRKVRSIKLSKKEYQDALSPMSKIRYAVSTALVTGSNPLTIVTFAALFSSLHHIHLFKFTSDNIATGTVAIILLCIGIFIGSLIWWSILVKGIWFVRQHIEVEQYLTRINHVSGIILILFGAHSLIAQIWRLLY